MVNDQEPRYRLVDSNGNVVGSLFQNADGNVEIQDETGTGSVFGPNGIVTPAIDAGSVSTETLGISNAVLKVTMSTDQDIPNDSTVKVAYDTVITDDFGGFDPTNNEYTIQQDGDYVVEVAPRWITPINSSTVMQSRPHINGSVEEIQFRPMLTVGSPFQVHASHLLNLTAGDVFDARILHRSGATETIDKTDIYSQLKIYKVA